MQDGKHKKKLVSGYSPGCKTESDQNDTIDVLSPFKRGLIEVKLIGTCQPASITVNIQNQAGCCSVKKRSLYVAMYHERTSVRNVGRRDEG